MTFFASGSPFVIFPGLDGLPCNNGSIYYGTANLEPQTNPTPVYWDQACTQPVAQPVKTLNGYVSRNGTPAIVYAPGDYSMKLVDSFGRLVFYAASATQTTASVISNQIYITDLMSSVEKTHWLARDYLIDLTAAIQRAINEVQGQAVLLNINPGAALISAAGGGVSITGAVNIRGPGRFAAKFATNDTSGSILSVNTTQEVELSDFCLSGPLAAGSLSLLALSGGAPDGNAFSRLRDLLLQGGYTAVETDSSYAWAIDRCYVTGFWQYGIHVANTLVPDAGDSSIENTIFAAASGTTASCIGHASSGGLRISNNKFNTGQYGYKMQLVASSSDLIIEGNSFENQSAAAMGFFHTAGSYNNLVIDGNQIAVVPSGILMNDPATFFQSASIVGNTLTAITQYGIIVDNASDIDISGNTIIGNGGIAGLTLNASVANPTIGPNKIRGFTTRVVNNSTNGAAVGFTRLLHQRSSGTSMPADTTEDIIDSVWLPALDINDAVRITMAWAVTNNANNKTLRVRLGGLAGTVLWTITVSATDQLRATLVMGNTGATNSQLTSAHIVSQTAVVDQVPLQTTVDTSVPQQLVITAQKATAGDTVVLYNSVVELLAT
jgi:hypothetical protein